MTLSIDAPLETISREPAFSDLELPRSGLGQSPLEQAMVVFRKHLDDCGLARHSKDAYWTRARLFAQWYIQFDGDGFRDVVAAEGALATYKRFLLGERKAPSTIKQALAALTLMFKVAKGWAVEVKRVPVPKPQEPNWLTKAEERKLRLEARRSGPRDEAIVVLMLETGGRVEEVAKLLLSDIPLTARSGHVRYTGKGDKVRRVKVPPTAKRKVEAWLWVRSECYPVHGRDELWWGAGGSHIGQGPLTREGIQQMIERLGRKAGIEGLHAHQLRHTCARRLLDAGTDIVTISEILGHGDVKTTMMYVLPGQRVLDDAMDDAFPEE